MGKLAGIAVRDKSREPMLSLRGAAVDVNKGIVGDFRGHGGKNRKRQITVVSKESWKEVTEKTSHCVTWTARRANLLVEGFVFSEKFVGELLQIGETVTLEITGETEPCERMDEACPGLREILARNWRGGVTCRVISGGTISIDDTVSLILRDQA